VLSSERLRETAESMSQYAALLCGINVGGKSLIKMTELTACFEAQGFRSVLTYIQSGNVLFEWGRSSSATLARGSRRCSPHGFPTARAW
jgi:Protein of unknown function (DUF1697)